MSKNPEKTILPGDATITRGIRDKNQTGTRRDTLDYTVKPLIRQGASPLLFAGEVIQLLLDKQGIEVEDFNKKLGYASTYFQTNIFNTLANDGSHRLTRPLREKMAALTGTEPWFWEMRNFDAGEASRLKIDMAADIRGLNGKSDSCSPTGGQGR